MLRIVKHGVFQFNGIVPIYKLKMDPSILKNKVKNQHYLLIDDNLMIFIPNDKSFDDIRSGKSISYEKLILNYGLKKKKGVLYLSHDKFNTFILVTDHIDPHSVFQKAISVFNYNIKKKVKANFYTELKESYLSGLTVSKNNEFNLYERYVLIYKNPRKLDLIIRNEAKDYVLNWNKRLMKLFIYTHKGHIGKEFRSFIGTNKKY